MRVGIVGAGVLGRLIARELARVGHAVALYDRGRRSASQVAAGLLSPLSGRELPPPELVELARRSLDRWPQIATELGVLLGTDGTLIVAHDPVELDELGRGLRRVLGPGAFGELDQAKLGTLEPELAPRFSRGLFLPGEAWLEPRVVLAALDADLARRGVERHLGVEVVHLSAGAIEVGGLSLAYDWVIDCRGLDAAADLSGLRGVRGELLVVEAPAVRLRRPVRLLDRRLPLYVLPRPQQRYVIGATLIESEDPGPISVRATLDLLTLACALHPGFMEAQVLESATGLRPATQDCLPLCEASPGLVRVNGAYRSGFTVGPAIAEQVRRAMEGPCSS